MWYYRFMGNILYKKIFGKNDVGQIFAIGSENWIRELRLTWNSLYSSKEIHLQKLTVMTISCQEFVFFLLKCWEGGTFFKIMLFMWKYILCGKFMEGLTDLIWGIILKVSTRNRGLNLKNTLFPQCLWSFRFHSKSVFFFNIFSGDLHFIPWVKESFRYA